MTDFEALSTEPETSMTDHPAIPRALSRTGALLLVLLALLAGPGAVQAQLGFGGGLNFNSLDDIRTEGTETTYDRSTGYHMGLFYDMGFGPVSLRPGVFYHRMGQFEFSPENRMNLSAIEVPLDVRVRPLPLPLLRPYLLGAPVLTFAQTDAEFSDAVEDLSLTADLGIGLQVSPPGFGLTLMPEIRYSIGVTDYMSESFQVGGTTIRPDSDGRRASKVMLRLNVVF